MMPSDKTEPTLLIGLLQDVTAVEIELKHDYSLGDGRVCAVGTYRVTHKVVDGEAQVELSGQGLLLSAAAIMLAPVSPEARFAIDVTIGIDFHWQKRETQVFSGLLNLRPQKSGLTVVNEVALEDYLRSVICSEMSASSPPELLRAHAVISRSWLLAQINNVLVGEPPPPDSPGRRVVWYDREAHDLFDVCADDHCQRYQGVTRQSSTVVAEAIEATRGRVLWHQDQVCDARFSKCCGGVTERYATAWHDLDVPYLVARSDREESSLDVPGLQDEATMRRYVESTEIEAHCNCRESDLLDSILPSYDRVTGDFFRWQERLDPQQAADRIESKLAIKLGRLIEIRPIARGPSGRLYQLLLRGEQDELVLGKELEIRRALSDSHLYSSAFVVDVEGAADRPEAFVLRGAGWGHGVGLCQIGAAVMAARGHDHTSILRHYFPQTQLRQIYD